VSKRKPKKLPIVKVPDTLLREESKNVVEWTTELRELAEDMLETMYQANGIGLAAVQVGKPINLIVIDIQFKRRKTQFKHIIMNKSPIVLVNPVIVEEDGVQYSREGCLSIPKTFGKVQRAKKITVEYKNIDGYDRVMVMEDRLAVVAQHEIEHLTGELFIDRIHPEELE